MLKEIPLQITEINTSHKNCSEQDPSTLSELETYLQMNLDKWDVHETKRFTITDSEARMVQSKFSGFCFQTENVNITENGVEIRITRTHL